MHVRHENCRKPRRTDLYPDPAEPHYSAYDLATGRLLTDEDIPKYEAWLARPWWMAFVDFLLGKPRAPQ